MRDGSPRSGSLWFVVTRAFGKRRWPEISLYYPFGAALVAGPHKLIVGRPRVAYAPIVLVAFENGQQLHKLSDPKVTIRALPLCIRRRMDQI